MGPFRAIVLVALSTLLLATGPVVAGDVKVWLTTPEPSKRLSQEPDLSFSDTSPDLIRIDSAQRYQEIVGFGAALTDASALTINRLAPAQRQALLEELFGPSPGLHLSFTRLTIGASDFSPSRYSLDDRPKGKRDPRLRHFSIAPLKADVLPVLKQMLAINPQLKVMASPWSAPGWMKSDDSLIKGTLRRKALPAYAQYFRRYVEAMAAQGVPIYALTIQNEPHFEPGDYPGMRVPPGLRAAFIGKYLGPLLHATHPGVRILDWDHNWDEPGSPLSVLADPKAARYVAGVAWHCYAGEPSAQEPVHDAHPDKETWLTECSGGGWSPKWSEALPWMAGTLVETTRLWSKGGLLWNLALDENHGPHTGGCGDCRGVVTIDSKTGEITRNIEYYALGHLSRFVAQGAVRIDSDAPIAGLDDVALRNPDGSIVLVAVNRTTETKTFAVGQGAHAFTYDLPAGAVATFVWQE